MSPSAAVERSLRRAHSGPRRSAPFAHMNLQRKTPPMPCATPPMRMPGVPMRDAYRTGKDGRADIPDSCRDAAPSAPTRAPKGRRPLQMHPRGYNERVSDPRHAAAAVAGPRLPQWVRIAGWAGSVLCWAVASDARPLVAVLSVLAAAVVRGIYVVAGWGAGRSVFWSAWFFAVAAVCELVWLVVSRLF